KIRELNRRIETSRTPRPSLIPYPLLLPVPRLADLEDRLEKGFLDLRSSIDRIQKMYGLLSQDPAVRQALAVINRSAKGKVELGPSVGFRRSVLTLERIEKAIRTEARPKAARRPENLAPSTTSPKP